MNNAETRSITFSPFVHLYHFYQRKCDAQKDIHSAALQLFVQYV